MSDARRRGGLELNLRWLWLPASLAVLFALRHQTVWLTLYVGAVMLGLGLWFVILPRRALAAERTFHRDALRHLAGNDLEGLDALADRQWLLARFGRPHVILDTRALAAAARGEHEKAHGLYTEALRAAPPEERPRIELNLAAEELATGRLESAEGRYRAALARRPDLTPARINLARVLIAQGESLREAARLAAEAVETCDRRERGEVWLLRAEALVRVGDREWRAALAAAGEAGADAEDVARVRALGPADE